MGAPCLTGPVAAVAASLEALGLLVDITHEAWVGADEYNKPVFATAVSRQALVQEGATIHHEGTGSEITTHACIAFFGEVPHNGAPSRREPIDPRDRLTLPSGYTAPIADNVGSHIFIQSGGPFAGQRPTFTVWLK